VRLWGMAGHRHRRRVFLRDPYPGQHRGDLNITSRGLDPESFVVLSYGEGWACHEAGRTRHGGLPGAGERYGPYDAFTLSLAGDVRISRTFRPISPVKMMLTRKVLDQLS
jgi:hypothetical protein